MLKDDNLNPHFEKVKKRFEKSILPCHFLAYFLHPKYKGEHLSYEQKEKAKEWLPKINPSFLSYILNFELQDSHFSEHCF